MNQLIRNPIFWAAMSAVGTICTALGAGFGIWVARSHLRQLSRSAGSDAIFSLYALFDDERHRDGRRLIWREISHKEPKDLTDEEWDILERTATSMDVVGTMVKHNLVKSELIFERYTEVILPLWEAMNRHVQFRRAEKGRYGWVNFEWLAHSCRDWSLAVRKTDTYQRF